jgi:predicted Zn-dependent peptidase
LKDVLANVRYSFAGSLATADKVATTAAQFIALGGSVDVINRYYALYPAVTSADVQRVARTYFRPQNRTVITLEGKAQEVKP